MFQSKWIMRSLVILLFALSGTALVLGIILFQQRETLKGRTQKLEMAAKLVAALCLIADWLKTVPSEVLSTATSFTSAAGFFSSFASGFAAGFDSSFFASFAASV